jgi:hypothetical protein
VTFINFLQTFKTFSLHDVSKLFHYPIVPMYG